MHLHHNFGNECQIVIVIVIVTVVSSTSKANFVEAPSWPLSCLSKDKVVRAEELTKWPGSDGVHGS